MSTEPLEKDALDLALAALPGWRLDGDKLKKTFVLGDFREAMMFLVRMSYEAEALNHHPEIHNVYKTVELALTTHDAGNKVTVKDVELAAAIEAFL
ncbi:MAG: 4a-hydroxytetrahydrobiopterin dehydratase [Myxococcales bacterium]|nr:4a-hydroxytetrahydrobiopterin dehydratase [Myxococcales bacterium]